MKRIILSLSMTAMMMSAWAASTVKPSKEISTERRSCSMEFTRIEVEGLIKLRVEERSDEAIVIRANENILPYIKVEVSGGCLNARFDNVSVDGQGKLVAEVSIPDNGRISAVSASDLASIVIDPQVRTENFRAELCGASKLRVAVAANVCRADASGASSLMLDFEGGRLSADISGASSFRGEVHAVKCDIDLSGAASATLDGESTGLDADASGASAFHGSGLMTEVCSADASGASRIEVACSKSLAADATGSSKILYRGDCRISSCSTSGFSSVKRAE